MTTSATDKVKSGELTTSLHHAVPVKKLSATQVRDRPAIWVPRRARVVTLAAIDVQRRCSMIAGPFRSLSGARPLIVKSLHFPLLARRVPSHLAGRALDQPTGRDEVDFECRDLEC
jgi:hypothetical protein